MRHVIFLDKKIPKADYEKWKKEDSDFWNKNCEVNTQYFDIETDFSDYPTFFDGDTDIRPTEEYVKSKIDEVYNLYNDYGTDFVMFFIHEDNWKSSGVLFDKLRKEANLPAKKGIWGTNWSSKYRNYHVEYCRWDKKNMANNFGTMYHERHHALDALIYTETGINANPLINVKAWDAGCTHGGETPYKYIRYKENTDSIVKIATHLREALAKRLKKHNDYITKNKNNILIGLLEKLVTLYRKKLALKDGVKS